MITLIDGLSLGSIYALIALGYTMVYGIAKMLNFAHGDIIMVGAYAILVTMTTSGNPIVGVVASIVVCTLLGVLIEKAAYKPLRGASPLAVLITAIGVSYLLQSLAQLIFESKSKPVPGWKFADIPFLKHYGISTAAVVTLVAGAIIMVGLTVFINVTRTGRAMLAVSEDRGAAILMGINVNRIITITFAIGGIGSIPGAMLGGILLGVIEKVCLSVPVLAPYTTALEFSLLIVILLVRPTGILGKKLREKV